MTARDVLDGTRQWACDSGPTLEWLRGLPDDSVHCAITSPPYWGLRSYLPKDHPLKSHEIGQEKTPAEYVDRMCEVFAEVRRVLHPSASLWLNVGDSYSGTGKSGGGEQGEKWKAVGPDVVGSRGGKWNPPPRGLKSGDLVGIPWMLAFALRDRLGFWLRSDCIWDKPNGMPESVTCRPGKAHEYVFQFSKGKRVFYDVVAVRKKTAQPNRVGKVERTFSTSNAAVTGRADVGRSVLRTADSNLRSVWRIPGQMMRLRPDLSPERKQRVVQELVKRGLM